MAKVGASITNTLVNAPLPLLIEKLGLSIATAQQALDQNSIALANNMAKTKVDIDGTEHNLISLGFVPTFYQFTEATLEVKLEFHLAESEDFSIGGSVGGAKKTEKGMIAASMNASYARKYEMSAEGASSMATRLVSLPPPERLKEILTGIGTRTPVPITGISVEGDGGTTTMVISSTLQLNVTLTPGDTTEKAVIWSITSGETYGTIDQDGLLSTNATGATNSITVEVHSIENPTVTSNITISITAV